MKPIKSLIAAAALAAASFGPSLASAADVSSPTEALVFNNNAIDFGNTLSGLAGDTFADQFTFSLALPGSVTASIASSAQTAATGLNITGLDLYTDLNVLVGSGTGTSGLHDFWNLSAQSLAAGNYYLQVSGTMASTGTGAFGGAAALNPVPEPETYGMMLAGLGVVGFLARRRKAANQA